jgi:hypothetical protein
LGEEHNHKEPRKEKKGRSQARATCEHLDILKMLLKLMPENSIQDETKEKTG